jgi:hypothetical protein
MQNLVEIIASSVVLAGDNGAELTLTIPVLGSRIPPIHKYYIGSRQEQINSI